MKLAFIDHSFHQKSTATRFLIELFAKYYDVDVFWDESWRGGSRVDISALNQYNIVVFFQLINYPLEAIRSISCANVILVPMYDAAYATSSHEWLQLRDYRFINFSSTLHRKMLRMGLDTLGVQYFLNPAEYEVDDNFESLRGFFWQRTDGITWNHVRQMIGDSSFRTFHIHAAVDPHRYTFVQPTLEEGKRHSITISNWFEARKDYLSAIHRSNIYFAPRLFEGIGMSFLEAMTMGKCVVAANHPTMNEYIRNGFEGYLYDIKNLQPVDLSKARELGKRAREKCILGYKRWVADRDSIVEFISRRNHRLENMLRTIYTTTASAASYPAHLLGRAKARAKKIIMQCCSR